MIKDSETINDKSFAMLGISRITCGSGKPLFGSSILHDNLIELRIKPAELQRHLSRDWYHATGVPYIAVQMSYSQFAEAITALNVGDGIPVTLVQLNGEYVNDCPFIDKRQVFEKEFAKSMIDVSKRLQQATEKAEIILNDKKPPTKAEKESILSEISSLRRIIDDHIPFMQSSFNEQMDKTVLEAKGEVEGFVMNKVMSAGLEGLQNQMKLLRE